LAKYEPRNASGKRLSNERRLTATVEPAVNRVMAATA
jgi:hypothetical protein